MRVSPHCFNSRRAYASLVATSIPAFQRPCTPPAGSWDGAGLREPGTVFTTPPSRRVNQFK